MSTLGMLRITPSTALSMFKLWLPYHSLAIFSNHYGGSSNCFTKSILCEHKSQPSLEKAFYSSDALSVQSMTLAVTSLPGNVLQMSPHPGDRHQIIVTVGWLTGTRIQRSGSQRRMTSYSRWETARGRHEGRRSCDEERITI
jgi:hypothetical protein